MLESVLICQRLGASVLNAVIRVQYLGTKDDTEQLPPPNCGPAGTLDAQSKRSKRARHIH